MTYQEKYNELREQFLKKNEAFFKVDNKIAETSGFDDITLQSEYKKAYSEWQESAYTYNEFMGYVTKNGKKPGDTYPWFLLKETLPKQSLG